MNLRPVLSLAILVCFTGELAGQANALRLERVPEAGRDASGRVRANLASERIGTKVQEGGQAAPVPGTDPQKAVSTDKAARIDLPAGTSLVPLELADIYGVNRVFFRSFSAQGTVRVIGSDRPLAADSPDWQELVPATEFGSKSFLDEDFADRALRYVAFEFTLTSPGQISPLGVMGDEFIDQASAQPPTAAEIDQIPENEKTNLVPYDFASLVNGSEVALVSSGPVAEANAMIDDDITTFYEFAADDPSSTLLLDLRANYRVNRLTLAMNAQPGRLEIYVFNVLPEQLNYAERGDAASDTSQSPVLVEADFFDRVLPAATKTFGENIEDAELDFDDLDAHYALLRWTPEPGSNNAESLPLRIHEISFIGRVPDTMASFRLVPGAEFAAPEPTVPENGGLPIPQPDTPPVEIPDPVSPR